MALPLERLAQCIRPSEAHALVLMDPGGWHISQSLTIPTNPTPIFLPPYSSELNAIERLWVHLRERFLSHCLFPEGSRSLS